MNSLIVRSYLGVIAFAFVSFILTGIVLFETVFEQDEWQDFKEEVAVDHQLLMLKLTQSSKSDWVQIVEEHEPVFDLHMSLVPRGKLESNEQTVLAKPDERKLYSDLDVDEWYALFKLPSSELILKVTETEPSFEELSLADRLDFFTPIVLVGLTQLFGVILLLRMIRKPIEELAESSAKLGAGDLTIRANTDSPEPIGSLAASFNSMANKIQQTIAEQDIMIGAIPHELRTPLSRLRFHSELARDKQNRSEFHDSLDALDQNFDELEQIVDEILELIKLKHGAAFQQEPFALRPRIQTVIDSHSTEDIEISNQVSEDFMITAHQDLLIRAIGNLVQNASKYAEHVVLVSARKTGSKYIVDIEDDGPGIPVQQRETVLSPFARLDESRHKNLGGIGLGLSLVKIIMEKHQGKIDVLDSEAGGALLRMSWPC